MDACKRKVIQERENVHQVSATKGFNQRQHGMQHHSPEINREKSCSSDITLKVLSNWVNETANDVETEAVTNFEIRSVVLSTFNLLSAL